jgi:hypothetical protein
MSNVIEYKNTLTLSNKQLESVICDNFGIKTIIDRNDSFLFIMLEHHDSCFTLMRKLRWTFEYEVYKKLDNYIIKINLKK